MDNFKLIYFKTIFLLIILTLIVGSCRNTTESVQSIDINSWTKSTQDFIKFKCDPTNIFQKELIPKFAFNDSLVFNNLNQYIQYRLNFRNIIIDTIKGIIDFGRINKIRIEEFYNNDNSIAIIYLENKIENSMRIFRITYLNKNIKFSEVLDLSKYPMNSYDGECILAMEYSIVTRFTIVTEFIDSGKYNTKFISLYH